MKSSTITSTKSQLRQQPLKSIAICPIIHNVEETCLDYKKSKRSQTDQNSISQFLNDNYSVELIRIVWWDGNKLVINQNFFHQRLLQKQSEIEFILHIGDKREFLIFCETVFAQSNVSSLQETWNKQEKGLFMITVPLIKKKKKIFILTVQSQQTDLFHKQIMRISLQLSSSILLFNSERSQTLQSLSQYFKKETININILLNWPANCYLVYSNQIKIKSAISISNLQQSFQKVIIVKLNFANTASFNSKIAAIIKSMIVTDKREQLQQKFIFQQHYFKLILKHLIQQQNQGKYSDETIKNIIRNIYEVRVSEAKQFYQQTIVSSISDKHLSLDQLVTIFEKINQSVMEVFNKQIIAKSLHEESQKQLLNYINQYQMHIVDVNVEKVYQFWKEQLNSDEEINDTHELVQCVQKINEDYRNIAIKGFDHNNVKAISQKLLILGRNGARLNVFGYDEKMKIEQLREKIDEKWKQLKYVREQQHESVIEVNQKNFQFEKYKLMQERQKGLQNKINIIKSEINLQQNIVNLSHQQKYFKNQQINELMKIIAKNKQMITYVHNSKMYNPKIIELQQRIDATIAKNQQILSGLTLYQQTANNKHN